MFDTRYRCSTIDNRQSTIDNRQSTIDNRQSTIDNRQSTIDNRQSTIDYRLSTIDYRLSTIDYRLSTIDYRLSTIDYRLSTIDYRLSTIDYRLSTIDYRLSTIDYRLSTIDYRLSTIDNRHGIALFVIESTWQSRTATRTWTKLKREDSVMASFGGRWFPCSQSERKTRKWSWSHTVRYITNICENKLLIVVFKKWHIGWYNNQAQFHTIILLQNWLLKMLTLLKKGKTRESLYLKGAWTVYFLYTRLRQNSCTGMVWLLKLQCEIIERLRTGCRVYVSKLMVAVRKQCLSYPNYHRALEAATQVGIVASPIAVGYERVVKQTLIPSWPSTTHDGRILW